VACQILSDQQHLLLANADGELFLYLLTPPTP
jgi:hypothetical protein